MQKIEPIVWKDSYKLGNSFIDDKHKKLIETVNLLVDCLNNEQQHESFFSIYHRLAFYAESHFMEEEHFFQQNHCPNISEHKKSHGKFIAQLIQFQKLYEQQREEIYPELFMYMKNWIENHILIYDKCMIDNMNKSSCI